MAKRFKTIGLIGKYGDPSLHNILGELSSFLKTRHIHVLLDEVTAHTVPDLGVEVASRTEIGERCELAIIIGGDGTLLNVVRSLADRGVPLLGINLGRLGFLVDVSPSQMLETVDEVLNGIYVEEQRCLLQTAIEREGTQIGHSDAFNDVAIHKSNVARMIELETYINGHYVHTVRADGLVVSSPTGSTAYALSAGGPIVHPTLDAIMLVPICPHTLSNRPLVIPGDSRIEIVLRDGGQTEVQVTCDGQVGHGLLPGDRIRIRRKEQPARLIHPAAYDYYEILREKLHWGDRPDAAPSSR